SSPIVSIAFKARLRVSSSGTPLERGPISTLSRTSSQGKSAKLWNTIATSFAGPATSSPPIFTVPCVGRVRPAMSLKRVDLPEPERPSSATISPVFMRSETSSRTGARASPEPVEKTWLTRSTSRIVATVGSNMAELLQSARPSETKPALRRGIEAPPEQPVEQRHEQRHHRDAKHNSWEIAFVGRFGDVGPDALGDDGVILPPDIFGDDRGVPGASRGGDRARQIEGRDGWNDDLGPPARAANAEVRDRFTQVVGKGGRAADRVEDDIPLRAEDDEETQPDVRVEIVGE